MTTKDQIEAASIEFYNKIDVLLASRETPKGLITEVFQRGALWMQAEMEKLIEQRELVAWDAAREPRKWTQVFGPQSHIPEGQRYETFEDWKKAK